MAKRTKHHAVILEALGLPTNLVELINEGRLLAVIEQERIKLMRLNAMLDAFERENPELAARLPWAQARQEWKAAGRPEPHWAELLVASTTRRSPSQAMTNLLHWPNCWSDPKFREYQRKASRDYKRRRFDYDPATYGRTVKRELKAAGYVDAQFLAC